MRRQTEQENQYLKEDDRVVSSLFLLFCLLYLQAQPSLFPVTSNGKQTEKAPLVRELGEGPSVGVLSILLVHSESQEQSCKPTLWHQGQSRRQQQWLPLFLFSFTAFCLPGRLTIHSRSQCGGSSLGSEYSGSD